MSNSLFKYIFSFALLFSFQSYGFDVFDSVVDEKIKENSSDVFGVIESENLTEKKKGKIIILNKITANSKEFELTVGSEINYGRAIVGLHKCANRNMKENLLLVSLKVKESADVQKNVFRGWIFSKNLSISSIEHPVYQLIAVSCS